MYLANDILQKSHKKGNKYNKEFSIILPDCFKYVINNSQNCITKLERLLSIWENRNVLHPNLIKNLKILLKPQKNIPSPHTPPGSPPDSPINEIKSNEIKSIKRTLSPSSSDSHKSKKIAIDYYFSGLSPSFRSMCLAAEELEKTLSECKKTKSKLLRLPNNIYDPSIVIDNNILDDSSNILQKSISTYSKANLNRRKLIDTIQSVLIDISSDLDSIKDKYTVYKFYLFSKLI